MIFLKDLLNETPDVIQIDDVTITWDGDATICHYMIYEDGTGIQYILYKTADNSITASDTQVDDYIQQNTNDLISFMGDSKLTLLTHKELKKILRFVHRQLNRTLIDGVFYFKHIIDSRVFKYENNYYHSSWESVNILTKYKKHIEEILKECNINPHLVMYQDIRMSNNEFLTYENFFGSRPKELTDYEKRKKEIEKKLHVDKAQLDRDILNVLRSKPKNYDELYAALERQFKMPIAKIKHIFSGIPLDKMVVKEFKKTISEFID